MFLLGHSAVSEANCATSLSPAYVDAEYFPALKSRADGITAAFFGVA